MNFLEKIKILNLIQPHINRMCFAILLSLFSIESLKGLRVFLQVYFYQQKVILINKK